MVIYMGRDHPIEKSHDQDLSLLAQRTWSYRMDGVSSACPEP